MLKKTTACAAVIALCATTAFAGGLSPEIVEAPVVEEAMAAPAGTSINPAFIVVGVLAALLIASSVGDDDDDDDLRRVRVLETCGDCAELVQ